MKFGLMVYNYTTNLGNEIQSIAARRFLPTIDFNIDHEKLNLFKNSEKVKMILNGWYLDCLESWPPSESINPLLISMHFNSTFNNTKEVISSKESKDFFSVHGPVGCRDLATLNLLNEIDIDAYFSGCLTLTLQGNQTEKSDYKYIVVNSNNASNIINYLKTKTNLDIYNIQQESIWSYDKKYLDKMPTSYTLTSFYNSNEKLFIAENLLRIYENAHCVITDRIHCAFPCLAFNTPVLFIDSAKFGPERIQNIDKLILKVEFEEYKNNYEIFNVDCPPKNFNYHEKIREKLIEKTKKFTGHLSDSYYNSMYHPNYIMNNQTCLISKTAYETRKYMNEIINLSKRYETKLNDLKSTNDKIISHQEKVISQYESQIETQIQKIQQQHNILKKQSKKIEHQNQKIEHQKNKIKEMENSNSWKLTKPLRTLKQNTKK